MNLIILAAGVGSRLRPFTDRTPKCLFRLGRDVTILRRAIDGFRKYLPVEITVVNGYLHEAVETECPDVNHIYNPFYGVTNSVASLWFARHLLDDDSLIINADVVMEDALVKFVADMDEPAAVLIDSSRGSNADYRVAVNEDHVVMMSKELTSFAGEYVGVTRLDASNARLLRSEIETMVNGGQIDEWYENGLVRMILNDDFALRYVDIPQFHWTEVDGADDLLAARRIYERDS